MLLAKDELIAEEKGIAQKKDELSGRLAAMADMEDRAKYYGSVPAPLKSQTLKKKMLLADPGLDFEISKKINNVGYADKNTYNKDKHRQRPPVHKYAVIGDPLEYGMDFSLHQTETHEKYSGHTPHSDSARFYRSHRQPQSASVAVEEKGTIPANIKAKYGSRFVEQLFEDEQAVERVKQLMANEKQRQQRKHTKVNGTK